MKQSTAILKNALRVKDVLEAAIVPMIDLYALAIVKDLVKASDDIGGGVTVTIRIPIGASGSKLSLEPEIKWERKITQAYKSKPINIDLLQGELHLDENDN